jgi:hypothetical protein
MIGLFEISVKHKGVNSPLGDLCTAIYLDIGFPKDFEGIDKQKEYLKKQIVVNPHIKEAVEELFSLI